MTTLLGPWKRSARFVGAVLLSSYMLAGVTHAATPDAPGQFVAGFLNDSSRVFTRSGGSVQRRRNELRTLFKAKMDIPLLATFMAGEPLQHASAMTQEHFRELLTGYLVQAFYSKIENFAASPFDVHAAKPAADGSVTIVTIVREAGTPPQKITWRLRRTGDVYRIVDVVTDGLSIMVLQRASLASTLREGGLPKLITMLEERERQPVPG